MSVANCEFCGSSIASTAPQCPHCGRQFCTQDTSDPLWLRVLTLPFKTMIILTFPASLWFVGHLPRALRQYRLVVWEDAVYVYVLCAFVMIAGSVLCTLGGHFERARRYERWLVLAVVLLVLSWGS